MKVKNRKLLSMVAVLAVSATTVCGAMSLAACGKDDKDASLVNAPVEANTISTATGKAVNNANGKTYYVTPEATKEGSGTSWQDPIAIYTILNSRDILKPGDTVYVAPGTYNWTSAWANVNYNGYGIVIEASGAYNNYINIVNAALAPESNCPVQGKEAILSFYGMDFDGSNRGVQFYADYIYWYGIDVAGAGDNGLYIGGNYNTVEYCDFYDNRDSGLQLGRAASNITSINDWPSYNLVKNCTSHNNYDNETYGENADGFAAKLTIGFGNVFDGCIAYRNSDDGWDLYAKTDTGNIGQVIMYNCVAFDNGYLEYTQRECNALYPTWKVTCSEDENNVLGRDSYVTRDGDGNGFKLGGSVMEGDVILYNCLAYNNRMHGVTDNSNPGVLSVNYTTSYNNSAMVDDHRYVQVQSGEDADGNPVYVDSADLNPNFGKILDVENKEKHGNIDVARQTYSYNNISHVLAVSDALALSLDSDAYRASVTDSIMGAYKIEGSLDADTQKSIKGTPISPVVSTEVFAKLPFTKTGSEYTFNLLGLEDSRSVSEGKPTTLKNTRVHVSYRNSDGSINMHDILAVKDYTKLLGDANKIGSVLNLGSYDAYTHFYQEDLVNGNAANVNESIVDRALEVLQLNCNPAAVYQDFDVPYDLTGCSIKWTSSDTNVLVVHDDEDEVDVSFSGSKYIIIGVYRDENVDKQVTLTAEVSYGEGATKVTKTKPFNVTVKSGKPTIGEVQVVTKDGKVLTDGSVIILDRYTVYREPTVQVTNGIDYSGKLLDSSKYTVESTYYYAENSKSNKMQIKGFTPSNAGVYTITHTVSMNSGVGDSVSMTYYVYVASADAVVDFVGDVAVSVYRDGYTISGEVSSATGSLYTVTSATKLADVTKENIKSYSGVVTQSFRGERVTMQFKNENTSEYYIYYALTNSNGEVTSKVYEKKVGIVSISTPDDFMKIAGGSAVGEEEVATTIYQLANDLDFSGVAYNAKTEAFTGMLNGMGHTIKNVTIKGGDSASLFYKVEGGTIENVKFDNIKISGGQKVGIVASSYGGYYYNIAITNIALKGTQRIAGLIGHIYEGVIPTYVNQISVVNDIPELNANGSVKNAENAYIIQASSNRASGIIGLIQGSNSMKNDIAVYVSDCFVNAYIVCGSYTASSIVGEYQDDYGTGSYTMEIDHCVSTGVIVSTGSTSRLGGIVGYQHGTTALKISNCASLGRFFYKNAEAFISQKNLSGIVGGYNVAAATVVENCVARMQEYCTNYDVSTYSAVALANPRLFTDSKYLGLDSQLWSLVYNPDNPDSLIEPFVTLNFLGSWE